MEDLLHKKPNFAVSLRVTQNTIIILSHICCLVVETDTPYLWPRSYVWPNNYLKICQETCGINERRILEARRRTCDVVTCYTNCVNLIVVFAIE